ncbi:expressed unknown protein [Seminavis robusta]|uniref:Beta-lactamase-related domain-containing protein n=1 Tax=Seminavis robusta TaxID=568900 RepID=A0A9N8H3B3_9STRA|nr:expressed unknown protein [Seminavis robusta]|eukprot:Sro35_g022300.1 n/a (131) ;mRNA; f:65106-65498
MRPASVFDGILLIYLLFVASSSASVEDQEVTVIDLSQPWNRSALYNKNSAYCHIQSAMSPLFNEGYAIAQNGELIAEGYVNGNTPSSRLPMWSATKAFATLLIGKWWICIWSEYKNRWEKSLTKTRTGKR